MRTYQPDQFECQVTELNYDTSLKEIFGNDLLLTYKFDTVLRTPRETEIVKQFSVVPLWYLKFLIDENPTQITDIGCGGNLFKPVLKKLFDVDVHGIDPTPNNSAADENDFFDSDFSAGHTNAYQSVFSINALHFVPLDQLTTRINQFYNVISPGGLGFLALNVARIIEQSDKQWLVDKFSNIPTQTQIHNYVCDELSTLDINFLVMDVLINETYNEYMDGNIRLVIKK